MKNVARSPLKLYISLEHTSLLKFTLLIRKLNKRFKMFIQLLSLLPHIGDGRHDVREPWKVLKVHLILFSCIRYVKEKCFTQNTKAFLVCCELQGKGVVRFSTRTGMLYAEPLSYSHSIKGQILLKGRF